MTIDSAHVGRNYTSCSSSSSHRSRHTRRRRVRHVMFIILYTGKASHSGIDESYRIEDVTLDITLERIHLLQ